MFVYYFDPITSEVKEFQCTKVIAGVELATAVNAITNETKSIKYIHLLYIVDE